MGDETVASAKTANKSPASGDSGYKQRENGRPTIKVLFLFSDSRHCKASSLHLAHNQTGDTVATLSSFQKATQVVADTCLWFVVELLFGLGNQQVVHFNPQPSVVDYQA